MSNRPTNAIPPASLTKIMTMFLALDTVKTGRLKLNEKIRISPLAAATAVRPCMCGRRTYSPGAPAYRGMAVASGNDAPRLWLARRAAQP